jgi:uncharacterized phage protein gp47/JayE
MPIEADVIYRNRDQIVADIIQRYQSRISDIHVEEDGNVRIFAEVMAEVLEGVYLANQIQRDNIFVTSANLVELRRHGEQYGLSVKQGTKAIGTLMFTGAGGTSILTGAMVGVDVGEGDVLYYLTTADSVIPNPGDPAAPVATDGGAGALPAGTYEWAYSFVTAAGETEIGPASNALVLAINKQATITVVAAGGPGTTARKLYRRLNGGAWQNVDALNATFANNVTTTGTDNDTALVGAPVVESTAERISVAGESEDSGVAYNAVIGAIRELVQVPDGVTDVTNTTTFAGATDEEDMETFRARLLDFIRNPRTGSMADLESWAEAIEGVDSATAFNNDNVGVATPGHVTVRIAGPNGSIPSAGVIAAVLADLTMRDIANITIHVATFTQVSTNVTVAITLAGGYLLADVTASVQEAITDYINAVPVGGTVYIAGLIDAIFGLPGVATVVVSTPATDQTATATQKRVPGTITVT